MPPPESIPYPPYQHDDGSIATRRGRFDFESPEMVDIREIAHALGAQARYTGHTAEPYYVAQHSVAVAKLIECWGESKLTQLAGLMHDAAEAYCGDVSKPLRNKLGNYNEIVSRVERVIAEKYGYPYPHPEAVRKADTMVYGFERRGISKHEYVDVSGIPDPPKPVAKILSSFWTPQDARTRFMNEFLKLV